MAKSDSAGSTENAADTTDGVEPDQQERFEFGTTELSGYADCGPCLIDYAHDHDSCDKLTGGIRLLPERVSDGTVPIETVAKGELNGSGMSVGTTTELDPSQAKEFAAALMEYAESIEEDLEE